VLPTLEADLVDTLDYRLNHGYSPLLCYMVESLLFARVVFFVVFFLSIEV